MPRKKDVPLQQPVVLASGIVIWTVTTTLVVDFADDLDPQPQDDVEVVV